MNSILISILILLTLALPVGARMTSMVAGGGVAAVAAASFCSACTTTDADELCDSFENTDCSWTDQDGGAGCTITRGASLTSAIAGCNDEGAKSMIISKTSAWQECATQFTLSGGTGTLHLLFYLNVNSMSTYPKTIVSAATVPGAANRASHAFYVNIVDSSGRKLQLSYYNGSGDDTLTLSTTLADDTWYPVRVSWVSGTSVSIELDSNNDGTFDDTASDTSSIGTRNIEAVWFAADLLQEAGTDIVIEFDNIKVDNDTAPTACTR